MEGLHPERRYVAFALRVLPLVLGGAIALAILLSAFSASFYPPQFDETMLAWDGKQIALGRAPYLDFFTFKPPATIFGAAVLFRLVGTSLGALRLASVLWLLVAFALLYAAARAGGLARGWASALALSLPVLLVPVWPLPSSHWFAAGLGVASFVATTAWPTPSVCGRALVAYTLAAVAFLAMQTHGLIAFATVTVYFFFERPRPMATRGWWLGAISGFVLPLAATVAYLRARGALSTALYDIFAWPARYYRGGGPGAPFWGSISLEFARRAGDRELGVRETSDLVVLGSAVLLLALLPLALLLSPRWRAPAERLAPEGMAALTALAASLAFFVVGRRDWVHAILFLPLCVAVVIRDVRWGGERARPLVAKVYGAVVLAFALGYWLPTWGAERPSFAAVTRIDAVYQESGPVTLLRGVDPRGERKPPIVFLSEGSGLYFFWSPDPPPVSWLLPASFGYDAPWEYTWLARFLDAEKIPFVFVEEGYAAAYLADGSDLAATLHAHYRPVGGWHRGTMFGRVE